MDAAQTRTPTPIDLLAEQWLDQMVVHQPELRVHLGREGDQAQYADHSPDGHAASADAARAMLRRLEAAEPADAVDRVTRSEMVRTLDLQIQMHDAGFWQRDLNVIASPGQGLRDVFDLMPTATADDWSAIGHRMARLPAAMQGYVESLRAGIASGNAPAARQAREVSLQARKLTRPDGFFHQLTGKAQGLPAVLVTDLQDGAARAAQAYADLARFLDDELLPQAPQVVGVGRDVRDGDETMTVFFTGCPGPDITVERVVRVNSSQLLWIQIRSDDRATANRVLESVTTYGI